MALNESKRYTEPSAIQKESVPRRLESGATIPELDPLHADQYVRKIPLLNKERDLASLIRLTCQILPSVAITNHFSGDQAKAALRDLGIFAGSLKRHNVEPIEVVPNLDATLQLLGIRAGTVPRDTIYSYVSWNPPGERQRKFTELDEEIIFIDSLRLGIVSLNQVIESLVAGKQLDSTNPDFIQHIKTADAHFNKMVNAMVIVRKRISPEVFTYELRPYFEPILIGEGKYMAPGGAQMPILLIDQLIWGSDCDDPVYQKYLAENLQYAPGEVREMSRNLTGQKSLINRLSQEIQSSGKEPGQAMLGLINGTLAFRMPHLAVAKANFKLRSESNVGSGGYSAEILEFLVTKTRIAKEKLKLALQ
jgi:hypothetical protein